MALVLAGMFWSWSRQQARERAKQQAKEQDERERREQRDKAELELMRTGTRLRAKVRAAYQFGTFCLLPYLEISLRVEAPDGEYDVDVELAVEPTKLHLVADGSMVDVAVDPKNREHLLILL